MPEYHLYYIDQYDHILGRDDFDAADDRDAMTKALPYCDKYKVDVWERERLVGRVAKEAAVNLRPNSEAQSSAL